MRPGTNIYAGAALGVAASAVRGGRYRLPTCAGEARCCPENPLLRSLLSGEPLAEMNRNRSGTDGRLRMQPIIIALIGAGSRSFGPETVRDVLLSEALAEHHVNLRLMDIVADNLSDIGRYAKSLAEKLGRNCEISTITSLEAALDGAQFVVTAVEIGRSLYWAQDYHIPRKYGFRQVFAENGGPGSLFHALRAMKGMVHIARTMERICPDAILLNYTNPMHKVCDAITTLSNTRCVGLCHGVWMGMEQVSYILDKPVDEIEMEACASITSPGSRRSATVVPGKISTPVCARPSAKATGWRTGTRSDWRASCCGGLASIPHLRAVTSANTSAGLTSSPPTSWTGSMTRRMDSPGKPGKCRSTYPSRMLMGPNARSRSRSKSISPPTSRHLSPPASSPSRLWSRLPAASDADSTPSTSPIAAGSPTCPTRWWWRSRRQATSRDCSQSGCSLCRNPSRR